MTDLDECLPRILDKFMELSNASFVRSRRLGVCLGEFAVQQCGQREAIWRGQRRKPYDCVQTLVFFCECLCCLELFSERVDFLL